MNVERLFSVLVMGGATIAAGCSADERDPALPTGAGGAGAEGGGSTSASAAGSGGDVGTGGDATGGSGQGGAGGEVLVCSETASPSDPCGCPCCWALDCANTDEACCGGFCGAGNDGAGCCGL